MCFQVDDWYALRCMPSVSNTQDEICGRSSMISPIPHMLSHICVDAQLIFFAITKSNHSQAIVNTENSIHRKDYWPLSIKHNRPAHQTAIVKRRRLHRFNIVWTVTCRQNVFTATFLSDFFQSKTNVECLVCRCLHVLRRYRQKVDAGKLESGRQTTFRYSLQWAVTGTDKQRTALATNKS